MGCMHHYLSHKLDGTGFTTASKSFEPRNYFLSNTLPTLSLIVFKCSHFQLHFYICTTTTTPDILIPTLRFSISLLGPTTQTHFIHSYHRLSPYLPPRIYSNSTLDPLSTTSVHIWVTFNSLSTHLTTDHM
jgi:hypothetical protein